MDHVPQESLLKFFHSVTYYAGKYETKSMIH